MANDFKRMWTEEEINKSVVILDEIGIDLPFGDATIDITKEQYDKLLNCRFIQPNKSGGGGPVYCSLSSSKWSNIDYDEGLGDFINIWWDGTYKLSRATNQVITSYMYEELVRSTPTDVSIIEDQGKLELMLEHDGNVLAVNDTPNRYLMRSWQAPKIKYLLDYTLSDDYEIVINTGENNITSFDVGDRFAIVCYDPIYNTTRILAIGNCVKPNAPFVYMRDTWGDVKYRFAFGNNQALNVETSNGYVEATFGLAAVEDLVIHLYIF